MKLFKLDVINGKRHEGREVLVHAESNDQARAHVAPRFTGWEIQNCIELPGNVSKHFVIADFDLG